MRNQLSRDDTLTLWGKHMTIVKLDLKDDKVYLHESATNEFKAMSYRDLRAKLAKGEGEVDQKCIPGQLIDGPLSSTDLEEYYYRSAIVERVEEYVKQGMSVSQAIERARTTDITIATGKTLPVCSTRSIYRHRKAARINGELLFSSHKRKGNRMPRYPERVNEITIALIKDEYSKPFSRFSILKLTSAVNQVIRQEKLLPGNSGVSPKYVQSIHKKYIHPDLDYNRLDPKIAKSQRAIAKQRIRPGAPLHRVEIDTVHLPFLARDDEDIVDNLYLMVAIDCETSMPLSWWLMRGGPTTDDTFSCLGRAMYSKEEELKQHAIKFDVDPFGGILNLYMDNGPENARPRLANVAQVGISPHWTESNAGHRKPFIERFFRSLKEALETLPGCTRFNGKDGARTQAAEKDPLMSVDQIEHWILRFLFERWPHQKLDRFITADIDLNLGDTPCKRWRHYEATMPLPMAPRRSDWYRTRFVSETGTLSPKTGLTWDTFQFKGEHLPTLINQYGTNAKVTFYYNPHDYRFICVADKSTGKWLELVNDKTDANSPAYSFQQAKDRIKAAKAKGEDSPHAQAFDEDVINKSREKPTKKELQEQRKKEVRQRNQDDAAHARAERHPMPAEAKQQGDDTFICIDSIKKFKTHKKGS